MMQLLAENWKLLFGGVGTALVAALAGAWAKSLFEKKSRNSGSQTSVVQKVKSGRESTIVQGGRDVSIGGE